MTNLFLSTTATIATQTMNQRAATTPSGIPPVILGIVIAALIVIAIVLVVGSYKKSLVQTKGTTEVPTPANDAAAKIPIPVNDAPATAEVSTPTNDVPTPVNDTSAKKTQVNWSTIIPGFDIPDGAEIKIGSDTYTYRMKDDQDTSKVWVRPAGSEDTLKSIAIKTIDTVRSENYLAVVNDPNYQFIVELYPDELYFYDKETLARKGKAVACASGKRFDIPAGSEVKKQGKLLGTFLAFDQESLVLRKTATQHPTVVLDGTTIAIGTYEIRKLPEGDLMLAHDSATGSFCVIDKKWKVVMEQVS